MSLMLIGSLVGLLVIIIGIVLYPALKVAPYAYSSARIRAAKGKLLTKEELHTMTKGSYKDVLLLLEKKGYPEILNLIEEDFREDLVHKSLRLQAAKEIRRLIDYVPKQHRPFFIQLYRKGEISFILSILRSKTSQFSERHKLGSLILPTKYFKEDDIKLFASMTLEEFISKMERTRHREIISKHRKDILAGDILPLENELMEKYFLKLRQTARSDPVLSRYARQLIDIHNTRMALCFGKSPFVEGGKIDSSRFAGVTTIEELKESIKDAPFAKHLQPCETTTDVVKALFRFRNDYGKSLARKNGLDISLLLAYSILKMIELKNIRIILKLINSRFTPKEIQEAII